MPLNINWQQILMHLFNFFLLLAILYFLLYEPVVAFIKNREQEYKEMDDKAKQNLAKSEELLQANQEKMANVEKEVKAYRKDKFNEVITQVNEKLDYAKQQEKVIIDDAKKQAIIEHDKILEQARKEVKKMAMEATKAMVGANEKDDFDDFIDYSLKEEDHE